MLTQLYLALRELRIMFIISISDTHRSGHPRCGCPVFGGEPVVRCGADLNGLLGLENGLEQLQSVCLKWAFIGLFVCAHGTCVLC